MELDCETHRTAEVTLVIVQLENDRATDRRVRLQNCLAGPVLPPRRNGEPEPGWDCDGVTTVVPAGGGDALGYACPAEPESPPVSIEWVGDADGTEKEAPVKAAMRRLGDARPPRAVLGKGSKPTREPDTGAELTSPWPDGGGDCKTESGTRFSNDIEALLRPYRERVEAVEALAAADVPTAADLLESGGGLPGVEAAGTELDADALALRTLAAEASALAARAEAATPPTETLRRLS